MTIPPSMLDLGDIALAADAEARAQTPPNGNMDPYYRCPGCPARFSHRGDLRTHLIMCADFRNSILGRRTPPLEVS